MAYDEDLANRVREHLAREDGVSEKAMFGGLAFLLNGNMAVTVSGRGGLMVRVGRDGTEQALSLPHTRLVEMRGRPMPGWIFVESEGVRTAPQVGAWARRGLALARTLPPK
jgi:TfoX/Sxy family transcriptional regulator of competence genes